MRSSDLFTTIAEKSRPTATTHSRSRTEPRSQRADETADETAHVAPRSGHVARFVARRSAPGMPVRLPLPSTRIGEGDGEASRSPPRPGSSWPPVPRIAIRRRDATRSGAGSGFGNSRDRGHADPGDRERDTRATRLTVTPQSRPLGHSKPGSKHCRARGPRGPRLGHAKGACPMPNARPLQYIQRIRMFTSYNTSFDFIAFMRVM